MYRAKTDKWYLERVIWLLAGCVILTSLALSQWHSPYWLVLTALVGVNLIVFALSGFCIMANLLYLMGYRSSSERVRQ